MVNKIENEQLQDESIKLMEKGRTRDNMLVEKWCRNDIGVGDSTDETNIDLSKLMDSNPAKARLVAKSIDNEEAYLQTLSETVIQSTFSTTPENLLKVIKKGVANSNRSEMFTELSLDSTDDALYFIDMTHKATLTGKQPTAGDLIFENAYEYTTGEANYKDQAGDADTSVTITADYLPIKVSKVHVTLDGVFLGADDGAGAITVITPETGTALSSGTVDYDTGILALTFAAAIPAASNVRMYYHYDSEDSDNYAQYPKVSLTISKKRFLARPMSLGYIYSNMAQLVLETQMNENAQDLFINAVAAEHARSRDYRAIAYARAIAKSNTAYTFNTKFGDEGEFSYREHAQRVTNVIDNVGGAIHDSLLRGAVNIIIAGNRATSYLRLHDLWVEDTSQPREGVYKAGKLAGMTVFTCPASPSSGLILDSNEMLLTYKNPLQPLDVSIAYGVLTELTAALNYPTFYVDGNIATVEDKLLITREFVRLLTLENLDTYVA